MAVSNLNSLAGTSAPAGAGLDQFRNADFLKIMMSELSQQDPFKPQETAEIVNNMQKLQELANTQFQKFRDDQRWAQDLVGQGVTAKQMAISDAEKKALVAKGLNPDVGYGNAAGTVDSFRVVDQTVYVEIEGKHYAIENVSQVNPSAASPRYLAELAGTMLGRKVAFTDPDTAKSYTGTVQSVSNKDGKVMVGVDGYSVPLEQINRIGLAS